MATKTITNTVRFSSRHDSRRLVDALEKASYAKQKKMAPKENYEEVKRNQVSKYASKFGI